MNAKPLIPLIALLLLAPAAHTDPTTLPRPLTERQKAEQALNRLAFGPRPGDVDRVVAMGVDRWIDEQLHPERIRDSRVDAMLERFSTLRMSDAELFDKYEKPVLEARKKLKDEGKNIDPTRMTDAQKRAMRRELLGGVNPRRPLLELTAQRILRAVYSERQLNEVMVDFWMNHFNVYGRKGPTRVLLTSFERDVIRPHMWGKFSDLLMATAKSPAMLYYLDNARSVADESHRPTTMRGRFGRGRMQAALARRPANRRPTGINENYARELMELQTLGVDGGYTQKDVTELARVLTGWAIRRPEQGGGFVFRRQLHDDGAKTVLGVTFPAGGGIEEGEKMIGILARSPATAHHLATELCQRLVADDPPEALVDRVAKVFLRTDGDIRQTVEAIVTSPEFFDPRYYKAKVKTPFEYTVSAVRAMGVDGDVRLVGRTLVKMGEPLYLCQPPTGYSDLAADWISSGALIDRMNFAVALVSSGNATARLDRLSDGMSDPVSSLANALVGGDLSESTRKVIEDRLATEHVSKEARNRLVAGLILGSPEFQKQ